MPDGRGCVPGEAPGHAAAGNSPLEGEATHICLRTAMACPLAAGTPWERGGGCKPGPSSRTGRVWPPSVDHGAEAQPRAAGQASRGQERGAELGDQLEEYPSPRQALAGPSPGMIWAGRFPAGFRIRPPVPAAALAPRCPLPVSGTAPVSLNLLPGATCRRRLRDLPFSGTAEIRLLRQGTFQGNSA